MMHKVFSKTTEIEGFRCFAPELAKQNDGFDPEGFKVLFDHEEGYFWFKERNKLILWSLVKFFPKADSFLEIGCGTGFVLTEIQNTFSQFKAFGSEIFLEGLKHAALRVPKETLFQLDARDIPFKDVFSVIGMFDVLEHIEEDELVLSQIYEALPEAGGILLTVPQHMFLWSKSDEYACHKRRYSRSELKEKLLKAGFKVSFMTSFVSILMPILLFSRLVKKTEENYDPAKEFKIPKILNTIFGYTLKIEKFFIKKGISMPLGSSLLVVAHK